MNEIEYGGNFDMLSTAYDNDERFKYKKEENNKLEGYDDFENYYLKYIDNLFYLG